MEDITPNKTLVEMVIISTGQVVHVKARLPWCWSWIQARVELLRDKNNDLQQLIDGTFRVVEFFLDPSTGDKGRSAISLLLRDVNELNGEFHSLCTLPGQDITLVNLIQLAERKFGMGQAELFQQKLKKSAPGQVFLLALLSSAKILQNCTTPVPKQTFCHIET